MIQFQLIGIAHWELKDLDNRRKVSYEASSLYQELQSFTSSARLNKIDWPQLGAPPNQLRNECNNFQALQGGSATAVYYEKDMTHVRSQGCKTDKLRMDLYTENTLTGEEKGLDFTFPIIKADATNTNSSVKMAETKKEAFWKNSTVEEKREFEIIPLVVDSFGRFGDKLSEWLGNVAGDVSESKFDYEANKLTLRKTVAWLHARTMGRQIATFLKRNCNYVKRPADVGEEATTS